MHTPPRPLAAALAAAVLLALLPASPTHAQATPADDAALEHIRLLEDKLREAGADVPARPQALREATPLHKRPIVPSSVDTGPFAAQARQINARDETSARALHHVRNALSSNDKAEHEPASDIIFAVYNWADARLKAAEQTLEIDAVTAYMLVDDALTVVGRDPIGRPLQDFVKTLRADRRAWRDIASEAAYRETMALAESIGLAGDWSAIDFNNGRVRDEIKRISDKLRLIGKAWAGAHGAELANDTLSDWRQRETQATADQPAWRYTWNLGLIHLGTEKTTEVKTSASGKVYIVEDIEQVFDEKRVEMFGTFQNTSDKAYRYTFVVGVSTQYNANEPWTGLSTRHTSYEMVQTPVLAPGELHNWRAEIVVANASQIKRAGLARVEPHEPSRR